MMRARMRQAFCILAALSYAILAAAAPPDGGTRMKGSGKGLSYGKRLSSQCMTCHGGDADNNSVPSIVGWPTEDFVWVLKTYRDGGRTNPEMVSAVRGLNESQIQSLAKYFGSLKPPVRLR